MIGTKLYKLNKSNESLLIAIHDEMAKFQKGTTEKIISAVYSIASIIFSALLTLILTENRESSTLPFASSPANIPIWLWEIIYCTAIFLLFLFVCWIILKFLHLLKLITFDSKRDPKSMEELCRYFHKKVLNDILTALSLEKKSYELNQGIPSSTTIEQDSALSELYLNESIFYFQEAISTMTDEKMFEPENLRRQENIDFLQALNPVFLCYCFDCCLSTLDRIKDKLELEPQDINNPVESAINYFSDIRERIENQSGKSIPSCRGKISSSPLC